jgi:hypothetical protein
MIDQHVLDAVITAAQASRLGDDLLGGLRRCYPGIHFSCCMDDDISVNARPVLSRPGINLYLVSAGNPCSVLTDDLSSACGVVIAEVLDD